MKTIHKEILFKDVSEISDYVKIELKGFIKILKIGKQKDSICLWYECYIQNDFENLIYPIIIRVIGTGQYIQDKEHEKLEYIDTLNFLNDSLIFHFYVIR